MVFYTKFRFKHEAPNIIEKNRSYIVEFSIPGVLDFQEPKESYKVLEGSQGSIT
jgi:hypothetical protein